MPGDNVEMIYEKLRIALSNNNEVDIEV